MKDTYIVLIPIEKGERKLVEKIENWHLAKSVYPDLITLTGCISEQIEIPVNEIYIFCLVDFANECNDQRISLKNYWLGYVHIIDDTFGGVLKSSQNAIGNTLLHLNQHNKETGYTNAVSYGMVDQANECTSALSKLNQYLK